MHFCQGRVKLWQKKVLGAFAVSFVLLALIGGSTWWFGYEQHKAIQGISAEARHITKEKIRDQLLRIFLSLPGRTLMLASPLRPIARALRPDRATC